MSGMTNDQAALIAAATSERGHSVQNVVAVAKKYAEALDTGLSVPKNEDA
ncbi:hypothetical protein LCGC14_1434630 [marine sediment metagenome]|uniref:Uncharacterized protein n=1 Tax=marine sediment metagenome TaxID=412755 RepID=A0A0F9JMH1_9ZZZZ